jgi:hypothetical protein
MLGTVRLGNFPRRQHSSLANSVLHCTKRRTANPPGSICPSFTACGVWAALCAALSKAAAVLAAFSWLVLLPGAGKHHRWHSKTDKYVCSWAFYAPGSPLVTTAVPCIAVLWWRCFEQCTMHCCVDTDCQTAPGCNSWCALEHSPATCDTTCLM